MNKICWLVRPLWKLNKAFVIMALKYNNNNLIIKFK